MKTIFNDPTYLLLAYVGVAIFGQLCHILKQSVRGETVHDIETYFTGNVKSILLSVGVSVVAVIGADQAGGLNFWSALLTGYAANSIFGVTGGANGTAP